MGSNRILYNIVILIILSAGIAQCYAEEEQGYVYRQIVDKQSGEVVPMVMLKEVVVVPLQKKSQYTRRGNPAVELLKNVIAHKEDNRSDTSIHKVKRYEKLVMNIEPFDYDLDRNSFRRDFKFLQKYVDTLYLTSQKVPYLPISMREKLSLGSSVNNSKQLVYGKSWVGFDKLFDRGTLGANVKALFVPIDVRENNINMMMSQFVSPLSSTQANAFYHYFILDTLQINGKQCIDLAFVPVHSGMLSFEGHIYVVNDSSYAVSRCVMSIPYGVNINWINGLYITQDFSQTSDNKWEIQSTIIETNFAIFPYARHHIYARHNINYEILPEVAVVDTEPIDSVSHRSKAWWSYNRPIELSKSESLSDTFFTEWRKIPRVRRMIKTANVLREQYIPTSYDFTFENSCWDFGPILNTVSYNGVEGWRVRIGGMTTAKAHPNIFFETYLAYGFKDKRPKGSATLTYSFNKKEHYANESLRHALSLTASHDLEIPGRRYGKIRRDNILLSIDPQSWMDPTRWNTKALYVARGKLMYEYEWANRTDLSTSVEYERFTSAGSLVFDPFQTLKVNVSCSFAPGKPLYNSRIKTNSSEILQLAKTPEFTISTTAGYIFETDVLYNQTEVSAKYRLWMSQFGYIDMYYNAGILTCKSIPYFMLYYPSANQSLLLSQHSFNMMRNMEFAMDKYVSWFLTYHLNGLVLNRIPYINRMNLRGVISFSGVYGHLSERHYNADVNPISYTMPYMEMTVGIENIFRLFRIDYVRRLSYNDGLTGWQKNGIKVSLGFNF